MQAKVAMATDGMLPAALRDFAAQLRHHACHLDGWVTLHVQEAESLGASVRSWLTGLAVPG